MQMWTRLPSLKLRFGNFDSVFVTSIVDDVLALHFVLVMSPSQTVAYAYLGLKKTSSIRRAQQHKFVIF